jgi:hypothetical protein
MSAIKKVSDFLTSDKTKEVLVASSIGGVSGAGIGYGANIGSRDDQIGEGNAYAAGIGAAAGIGLTLTTGAVGSAVMNAGIKGKDFVKEYGAEKLATDVADVAADVGIEIGKRGLKAGRAVGRTAMNIGAGVVKSFSDTFLEVDPKFENAIDGVKLSKWGKAAAGAFVLGASILGANDSYNKSRMGTPSGAMTTTPIMDGPSTDYYTRNAAETYGAGGDLVFALNRNRRG